MTFFEKTKDLQLFQYFDPEHPDVRVQLRELFVRTKAAVLKEKQASLEVVLMIGCLERKNAAVNLGLGRREILAKELGLTINQYWKKSQAGRVLTHFPEFVDLVRSGQTHLSHIAMIAPKITEANRQVFLTQIPGKSEREVRELIHTVNSDGTQNRAEPKLKIQLELTRSEMALLDRAREVLSAAGKVPSESEALVRSLRDLLDRRDPLCKAERAERRQEKKAAATALPKSENLQENQVPDLANDLGDERDLSSLKKTPLAIMSEDQNLCDSTSATQTDRTLQQKTPRTAVLAKIRHQVMLRDQGRCTYVDRYGNRCCCRVTLQIDHIVPFAANGTHELSNLRLLCRSHNMSEAQRLLGHLPAVQKWKDLCYFDAERVTV